MSKPACPFTYPHTTRSAKVGYLCSIYGYSSSRGRYPIAFDVGAYHCDFSFAHIWDKYAAEFIPASIVEDAAAVARFKALAETLHTQNVDYMWEWGREDACRGLIDDDTYKCLWDGTELSVVLELHGRGGRHLVLSSINGLSLSGLDENDLHDTLMAQSNGEGVTTCANRILRGYEWEVPTATVNLLYKYVRQAVVEFTPEKASAEVEYQGAWQFFANTVEPAWENAVVLHERHEAVVACANALHTYLSEKEGTAVVAMVHTLATAAGVSEAELYGL